MGKVTKLLSALAEEYGDDIVRTVRRVLGEGAQPEQIEAAVKRTAAQTPKPRSRAAPNLRAMDTDQAIRTARKKPHLRQASDGQYVGAPRGVRSERQLASNRRNFDRDVASGADKYTAFGTGEQVPYKESAHLPGINAASDAERLSFSRDPGRRWDDANQRDVIYDALGLYQRPSIQGTGVYTPPDGVLENNPVSVARPLIGIKSPGKLDDASRSAMNLAETLRSYVDAQGSGAWHSVFGGNVPDRGSLFASRSGPSDPETVKRLMDISAPYGLGDVVDTGQGLTITNFYPGPPSGGATSKALRTGGLREQIANVTDAPLERVAVDSNYIGMLEEAPTPGAGVATRILLDEVAKNPESVMDKLDAYDLLRQRYTSGAEADDAVAATYGGVRSDIQTARRILAEKGIRGLKAAYEAGVPLPALLAATGLSQYRQSDDDGGY